MDLTTIEATARVAGLHHWPDAPAERFYLHEPHRHDFVARCEVIVGHDNRAVEFHDMGDDLGLALRGQAAGLTAGSYDDSLHDFGPQSCEHLARAVVVQMQAKGYRVVQVSVSEDDEFTARVMPGVELVGGHVEQPAAVRKVSDRITDPSRVPGAEPLS